MPVSKAMQTVTYGQRSDPAQNVNSKDRARFSKRGLFDVLGPCWENSRKNFNEMLVNIIVFLLKKINIEHVKERKNIL